MLRKFPIIAGTGFSSKVLQLSHVPRTQAVQSILGAEQKALVVAIAIASGSAFVDDGPYLGHVGFRMANRVFKGGEQPDIHHQHRTPINNTHQQRSSWVNRNIANL
jgi:hypothetical protein